MKLLVIGGSRFVGRHMVAAARARGDRVTLFNRGLSAPAPQGVEFRQGDRRGDLSPLAHGEWDAVIDTCGYLPGEVARMAQMLKGRVGRYLFVSSVSVYASAAAPNHEDCALGAIDDPDTTTVDARTYGPLKALCEAELQRVLPAAVLLLRPGLVVGPHDPTQRFTYWPARLARAAQNETVLAPGTPDAPVQFIDARDLAAFALHALQTGARGAFNVVSEAGRWTFGDVLRACAAAAGVVVRFAWHDIAALQAQGIEPWSDMPLAVPTTPDYHAFMRTDARRAAAAGLTTLPLEQTVAATLAWYRSLPAEQQVFDKAGLSREREAAALAALRRA
jgi:2'-hydroxyisoflavone reductase